MSLITLIFWTVTCITAYCIVDRVCITIENLSLDDDSEYVVTAKEVTGEEAR